LGPKSSNCFKDFGPIPKEFAIPRPKPYQPFKFPTSVVSIRLKYPTFQVGKTLPFGYDLDLMSIMSVKIQIRCHLRLDSGPE